MGSPESSAESLGAGTLDSGVLNLAMLDSGAGCGAGVCAGAGV